ncbi:PRC-barrel domain containing protein [Tardiphaga alba]|uniref:PRC-barrel domain containing protein n=1 Tax=Tardiphaga alba TaxID=340268 RepID=A0ABX8A2U6_9BRAD|nr:PRC-barrel domain-containing protein [Tardiphaga alba]QUS37876.1 PRC-barrel domain containing protein [Tardiphaga alba]
MSRRLFSPAIRVAAGLAVIMTMTAVSLSVAADAPPAPESAKSPASTPSSAPEPAPEAAPAKEAAPPPPKPEAATPAALPPSAKPPSVTVIDAFDAKGILGRDVRSPASENMGRISDVVVDRAGQIRGAVIDFGGFLGVGSRKIVVDWAALHFWNVADKTASITLDLTREQVRAAPEYKDDQPIVVLGASGTLTPLKFPPLTMQER